MIKKRLNNFYNSCKTIPKRKKDRFSVVTKKNTSRFDSRSPLVPNCTATSANGSHVKDGHDRASCVFWFEETNKIL